MVQKVYPDFVDRSDGILNNHEEKPPASLTSYGTTPDRGLEPYIVPGDTYILQSRRGSPL